MTCQPQGRLLRPFILGATGGRSFRKLIGPEVAKDASGAFYERTMRPIFKTWASRLKVQLQKCWMGWGVGGWGCGWNGGCSAHDPNSTHTHTQTHTQRHTDTEITRLLLMYMIFLRYESWMICSPRPFRKQPLRNLHVDALWQKLAV